MTEPTRVALYVRVSTTGKGQTTRQQVMRLNKVARDAGWNVVETYRDEGVSGTKASRPALDKLKKDAVAREFDTVACVALDRLGRSTRDVLNLVAELHALDVDLYLDRERLDTSTPMGAFFFSVMASVAELERNLIVERINDGLERARKHGTKSGRPIGSPPIAASIRREVTRLTRRDYSKRDIAKTLGISEASVARIRRAEQATSSM